MTERLLWVLLVAAAYVVMFLGIEMMAKRTNASGEVVRKTAHILAGTFAALFPLFLSYQEIAIVGVILVAGVAVSLNRNLFTSVRNIDRASYGEVLFPLGITLVALLFPDFLLYTYAILTLALADALASVVGQAYGRRTYSLFGSHKSYVGSWTFFIITTLVGSGLLLALTDASYVLAALIALPLAGILTMVEAVSSKGLDNLTIPLTAGSLLWVIQVGGWLS